MIENILLLTIDSIRADTIHEQRVSTPHINRLVDEGVSFSRAFATGPGTSPSFPALLTGTMPLSYDGMGPLSDDRPRLSAILGGQGYETAAFHCNPFLSSHFNYDVGFDEFVDYQNPLMGIATSIFPRGIEMNNPILEWFDDIFDVTNLLKKSYQLVRGKPRPYVDADVITDDAINWLSGVDEPFFGWVHYMDVHQPCHPPLEYREQFGVGSVSQEEASKWYSTSLEEPSRLSEEQRGNHRRLADASVKFTDDQIGRILNQLENSGRFKDTVIVFASDHGHLYGEYGEFGKPERMYDELLHVPLVIANADLGLESISNDLVSLLDVPRLIHSATATDGTDLYEGEDLRTDRRTCVAAEHDVGGDIVVGARSTEWLYEVDNSRNEKRLYSYQNTQMEQVPPERVNEVPEVVGAVHRRLDSLEIEPNESDTDLDEDIQARLEDLGYL